MDAMETTTGTASAHGQSHPHTGTEPVGHARRLVIDLREGVTAGDPGLAMATPAPAEAAERSWPFFALGLLAALNLLDVVSTHLTIRLGATEQNPLAAWLLQRGGLGLAKATAVMLVAVLACRCSRARWVRPTLWMVSGIYLTVVTLNVVQLAGVRFA
jgi:hypothetical protein